MPKKLSEMTNEELWQLFPIILSEYNDEWPKLYEIEKNLLLEIFGPAIARIHHIGSTSVPGLKAKPTIDILLELKKNIDLDLFEKLAISNGYLFSIHKDNPEPSIMLKKGYTEQGFIGQAFHIHVRYMGDWDELYFRDYLREHLESQKEYVFLKESLFTRFEHDRDAYTFGKTEFVRHVSLLGRKQYGSRYQPE